jgi:acetoin utilization deacetylase AcuC-like enzyme/formylglycine-generating enzyme required for sulfatase activity
MTTESGIMVRVFRYVLLLSILITSLTCRKTNHTQNPAEKPQEVTTSSGVLMLRLAGGWFEMGRDSGNADEQPKHRVFLQPFLIDKYEVTQEEYSKYPLPNPSHFKNPKHPVEQMTWRDGIEYCNERSRAEGLDLCYDLKSGTCNFAANGYRLPTEAEWEYACRAGSNTKYSFGNKSRSLQEYGWFKENSLGKTHPVGKKKPNPWGLYDIHGNVAEWSHDWYAADYYPNSPEKDPQGPARGTERVLRGGAWNNTADACRSTYRSKSDSLNDSCRTSDAIGFRCVRNAALPKENNQPSTASNPFPLTLTAKQTEKTSQTKDSPPAKSKTGFVYDEIYLKHLTGPGHPERPERLLAIIFTLKESGLYSKLYSLPSKKSPLKWIKTVHAEEYVERAKDACRKKIAYLDSGDVPICPDTYDVAVAAVGGVLGAVDAVMAGKVKNAFCAIRPPGHHALPNRAMGFCIFNNVAIAARYIQKEHKLNKVLIVDWDVHHGNGTQELFYEDPTVFYFGIHQYPFYPGTGAAEEKGAGKGLDYTLNIPLPPGCGDKEYIQTFEQKLKPAALKFKPDFILISAGFDAQQNDLLGGMQVTPEGFARLTYIVKEIAETGCQGRMVSVLEGGYHPKQLGQSVLAHVKALME